MGARQLSGTPPPPPGFTLDVDALAKPAVRRVGDPPPPPEGFQLDQPGSPEVAAHGTDNADVVSHPIDGDTLALASGRHLRVYGVDAPELRQQGWDRQGRSVPIGKQSANATTSELTAGDVRIGKPVGVSYGRPVAPVDVDGHDLGLSITRGGDAFAAPSFIRKDPQRRYDYVQAERLARQNRLGVHSVFMPQTPEQFRHDPTYVPTREQIAQWWDTPTPAAGLTADAEQGYLRIANTGTAADILSYAEAHGFKVNPAEVRDFVAKRDAGAKVPQAVTYRSAPKPLTDLGDDKVGAAMRGVGNGVLPNFLEEVGAIPDTFGLTPGRENIWNSDRRLADIYHNNYEQNEAITGFDRAYHPYVTGAGELAGGLVLPLGRVRSAADLAKWGAGFGLISGLGQDGTVPQRLTSGAVGLGEGLVGTVLGGKLLEAAAPYVTKSVGKAIGRGAETASPADLPLPPDGYVIDDAQMRAEVGDGPAPGSAEHRSGGFQSDSLQQGHIAISGAAAPHAVETGRPIAMQSEPDASLSMDMSARPNGFVLDHPGRIDQPLTDAQMRARAADIEPSDVVPIASNEVGSLEEAAAAEVGRYVAAKPIDEATALQRRTVTAQNGRELSKRGPLDLVTWLRTQGGLKDQGGNLRAMGIDNAPRDMDFARGEQRFGKLIDDQSGMSLDDAALKAWEAGYLPGNERPDINTFLDAVDRTHSGAERYYHPEDLHEVERFHGLRSDRQQLEEQLANGPVHIDRSVPADEGTPFPPPEAYEEWPAGGPDFAGNIDLNKLDTPQEIKRALDFTHRQVGGFDAATRGRITHAETERLAGELGMTPDALLARRKGQAFNAEEAHAARQILAKSGNELVNMARRVLALENPGDDLLAEFRQKWLRHVAIQEQVAGATAEAGRALAQFKMTADSRAIRGEVLSSLVHAGGGPARIREAAETLLDAVEAGPGVFNAVAEKAARPRFADKLTELYINFLLSGPTTHVVNTVSNTLTSLGQIPEHAAAAAIGVVRKVAVRQEVERVTSGEVGQRLFGLLQGAKEGARMFARAARTGEPSDTFSKVQGQEMKAISGLKGDVIRMPTRLLTAEDELFKGIARRMELNGLAARQAHKEGLKGRAALQRVAELAANPSDDMLEQSLDYARYATFQRPLGPVGSNISRLTNDAPWLRPIITFVRTPTNLLKFAVERSPAAPLLKEWRADITAGGARRDLALARAMVGTGFGALIYNAALDGQITGSTPSDEAKARFMRADGWQPYSFKVGNQYYSYSRLDPFATTIGVAADLATKAKGMTDRQLEDYTTLLVASIIKNMGDKTWLSGVSDFTEAISDPERNMANYLRRLGAAFLVPNVVTQTERAFDPYARDAKSFGTEVQSRIPAASETLPVKRDIWGEPIRNELEGVPAVLSPVKPSEARNDPVNVEMLRIGARFDVPQRFIKVDGRRVDLTPEQYDRYSEIAGRGTRQRIEALMAEPSWKGLSEDDKQERVRKAATAAKAQARGELFGGGAKRSGSHDGKVVPPPPPGYQVEGEAGGRNVFADLQRAIPGIRFTSGYRTPEYQADMRRRGYHPAANSGHLDGSSFDLLPPPGKTIAWLRQKVRQYDPKVRMLDEGDHLHTTFAGYYGAPAIGEASRAGLKNPLIGMPPPPAGFRLD